ncbi:MAG: hypothetical protein M3552_13855, partial [Planctomycetota bacterium]|nr:hypothetical protein [Planctomycetota bacterium]
MSGSKNWQAGRRPDGHGRRAEWSYRSDRRSVSASRRHRVGQLTLGFIGLALLAGAIGQLALRYQPVSRPALAVIGDPLYRDLELPPNAGADQQNHIDLVRLQRDAGHLFADVGDDADRDWNLLTADRVFGESRDRLRTICRELSDDERVVVRAERDSHPDVPVRRKMLVLWLLHCGVTRDRAATIAGLGRA